MKSHARLWILLALLITANGAVYIYGGYKRYMSAKFYNWGVAEYNNHYYRQAEGDFIESLRWNPKAGWASFWLAQTSEELERKPELIEKLYIDAATNVPDNTEYAYWTGEHFYRTGKYSDAKHWYLKAHEIDPKYKWPLMGLAKIEWIKNNNLEAAATWYEKVIRVAPHEYNATYRVFQKV